MNATVSKQEVREAYIASVVDKIVFLSNGWAKVPSSDGKHEYIVTVVHHDIPGRLDSATDCGCYDCHRDNGACHFCKHREAVEKRIERDRAAIELSDFKARVADYAKQCAEQSSYNILDAANTIRVEFNLAVEKEVSDLPYHATIKHNHIVLNQTEIVIGSYPRVQHRVIRQWKIFSLQEWEKLREELMPLDDLMEAYAIYKQDPSFEKQLKNIEFQLKCRGKKVE